MHTFLGSGRFRGFPPIWSFSIVDECLDNERHTVKLGHTQVVFFFSNLKGARQAVEKHAHATAHEVFHFLTGKLIAAHTERDTLFFGTRIGLTPLVS